VSTPHLLHVFSTFVPAGPQVRVAKLLAAFGAEFRHSIVAMDGVTTARELLLPELDVRFLDPPPKAGSLATARRMRALLRRERPGLLLTYNFGAIDSVLAARSLGLRNVVHHEDGFLPDEVQGFKRRRVWLRRIALGGAAQVVVISRNLERIARELWKLDPSRVHFIANGIEVERFEVERGDGQPGHPELRAQLGIPRDAVVVGAVGHLRPEKNLPRLLAAVAAAQRGAQAHVLLLGDGPERVQLKALAAHDALRGRVHFAGYQADPRAYYRAMDVFALSSDTEQMPIALLEAMASSLPVLSTNVGDVRAMLPEDQAPFVVDLAPECTAQFAAALDRLVADVELRRRLGAANRARAAQEFALDRMVHRYGDLYRSLIAR
jgi:glycosyltransferase involved in cell wall biosynthesis